MYFFVIFQCYILEVSRIDFFLIDDRLILLEIHVNYSIALILLLIFLERSSRSVPFRWILIESNLRTALNLTILLTFQPFLRVLSASLFYFCLNPQEIIATFAVIGPSIEHRIQIFFGLNERCGR